MQYTIFLNIKSLKTNLSIISKSLISSNLNLFKDTENPSHYFVSFFFLFIFVQYRTLNILKVRPLIFWLSWNCYERLLQFELATINILIWHKTTIQYKGRLFIRRKLTLESMKQDQYVHTSTFHSNNTTGLYHSN